MATSLTRRVPFVDAVDVAPATYGGDAWGGTWALSWGHGWFSVVPGTGAVPGSPAVDVTPRVTIVSGAAAFDGQAFDAVAFNTTASQVTHTKRVTF